MKEADGGYLFLDEVHRLSFETRRNYSCSWIRANTVPWETTPGKLQGTFHFATTEQPEEVLLETFPTAHTLQIPIPSMMERPLKERLQMLYLFYQKEAGKVNRRIEVDGTVAESIAVHKSCREISEKLEKSGTGQLCQMHFTVSGTRTYFTLPWGSCLR